MKDHLWTSQITHLKVDETHEHSHNPLKQRVRSPLNGLSRQTALRLGQKMNRDSRYKH